MISGRILLKTRNASPKFYRGNQNTYFLLNKSFSKKRTACKVMFVKYGKSAHATDGSTVLRMVCLCWITKTTNTHSDYVIYYCFLPHNLLQNAPNRYAICTLNKLLLVRFQKGGDTKYCEMNSIKNSQHLNSYNL